MTRAQLPSTVKPLVIGFFGARGTGKTVAAIRCIEASRPGRLIVWDFKHDPMLTGVGRPVVSLPALQRAMAAPRWQLRYLVNHDLDIADQFRVFCVAAWIAGDLMMFVDELPEVTAPGYAPKEWRKLVRIGRQYERVDGRIVGITIVGAGQRATEIDKTFLSNLDIVRAGRMGHEDDARAMAKKIGCTWADLMTLPDLEYYERAVGSTAPQRGRLQFRRPRLVSLAEINIHSGKDSLGRLPKEANLTSR